MPPEPASHGSEEGLLDLIGQVLDGAATPEQQTRLNDLLAGDAEARRTYRRYVNLHVALHTYSAVGGPLATLGSDAADGAAREAPSRAVCASRPHAKRRSPLGPRLAVAAVAVTLAAAALVCFGPLGMRREHGGSGAATVEEPVARITKAAGARWGGDLESATAGTGLQPGRLELLDGLAELAFSNGARIVLEAPVRMSLLGPQSAQLARGRLVACVPPQARGFSIETPHTRVVDLGTEFGVGVSRSGDTEVQVFRGAVVAEWQGPEGKAGQRRLEAGQAVSIGGQTAAAPRGIPFEPERFVRVFPADRDSGEPGGPLYNRSCFDAVHVVPAPAKIAVDGDLSDWDRSGAFYCACLPPYHESHYLEAMMMYDERFLYLGAHVGDPAPMRSVMEPGSDPQQYPWRGGGVIVRLSTSPRLGWPLAALGLPEAERSGDAGGGRRPVDLSEQLVHLTMWYYRPAAKPRLALSYGMDFHGERVDPAGWQGAFRMDPNGRGYTLEYAVAWSLLNAAQRPPRLGDVLAANWTVHWSDAEGRLSRGHLVEITNLAVQPYRFLRASTWGKALYHEHGRLPPGTVAPRSPWDTVP
jgi:hypothetical protein